MIRLIPDRQSMAGDGKDAQPYTVQIVDARGRVVPTADPPVSFSITGPGTIIGLNNGIPPTTNLKRAPSTARSMAWLK